MIPWWRTDPNVDTPPLTSSRLRDAIRMLDASVQIVSPEDASTVDYYLRGRGFQLDISDGLLIFRTLLNILSDVDQQRLREFLNRHYIGDGKGIAGYNPDNGPGIIIQYWQIIEPGISDEQLLGLLAYWHHDSDLYFADFSRKLGGSHG